MMPLTAVFVLVLSCCAKGGSHSLNELSIVGDNSCKWNLRTLLKSTGLKQEHILFAQFQPEVMPVCAQYISVFCNGGIYLYVLWHMLYIFSCSRVNWYSYIQHI